MKQLVLRFLLTLLAVLSGTTISAAAVQEAHGGIVSEKAYVCEAKPYVSDEYVAPKSKVDDVISETLNGNKKNITSQHTLTADEALTAGEKFVGPGYKEIGKPGSGVFRSSDGTRQFRMDNNSLQGNHAPNVPHVHLETYAPGARKPTVNNHIPFIE